MVYTGDHAPCHGPPSTWLPRQNEPSLAGVACRHILECRDCAQLLHGGWQSAHFEGPCTCLLLVLLLVWRGGHCASNCDWAIDGCCQFVEAAQVRPHPRNIRTIQTTHRLPHAWDYSKAKRQHSATDNFVCFCITWRPLMCMFLDFLRNIFWRRLVQFIRSFRSWLCNEP